MTRLLMAMVLFTSANVFAATTETPVHSHFTEFSIQQDHSFWDIFSPKVNLTSATFSQPIDHFGGAGSQTFQQRYWIDSEFASSPNAPVIYHICGEGDAEQGYFLHDSAIDWAKALGAHLVYLEHRYYGKSLPYADLSSDHLKFLTLNNVLEDLATFQKWIMQTQGWTGKWISVGGSYSGTLSALYRQAHPELVAGALASSAPMISGGEQSEGTQQDVNENASTDPSTDTGERQWTYEGCTSFGFWIAVDSTVYTPSSWLCQQLFGSAPLTDVTAYNQKYYTPFISKTPGSPSNILFTYGGNDVWTQIGISAKNNTNPGITVQVIQGAGHHEDLNASSMFDSAAVKSARDTFLSLAKGWVQ